MAVLLQLQEHSDCGASMLHAVQHDGDGVDLAADGGTTSASSTVPNSRRGSTFSMAAVSSAAGANLAAAMAGGVAGQGDVSSSASNSSTQGNPVIAALIKSPPRSRGGSEISHPKLDRIPSMKRASSPSAGKSSNSGGSGQTSGSHDAGDTDGSHSMINLLIPRIHKPKAISACFFYCWRCGGSSEILIGLSCPYFLLSMCPCIGRKETFCASYTPRYRRPFGCRLGHRFQHRWCKFQQSRRNAVAPVVHSPWFGLFTVVGSAIRSVLAVAKFPI